MNFDESNDFMSDKNENWKKRILKNETKRYSFDFVDKYHEYLNLRFFEMKKGERLWIDRLSRIKISEKLFMQKKNCWLKCCIVEKFFWFENFQKLTKSNWKLFPRWKFVLFFIKFDKFLIFKFRARWMMWFRWWLKNDCAIKFWNRVMIRIAIFDF